MKEFLLLISGEGNPMATLSADQMQKHIQKVGAFIQRLAEEGKLKSCAPLEFNGVKVSGTKGNFTDGPYNETKEVISGFYHILANDLDEAVAIAKADPRFQDSVWSIEVRPVLKVEGIN